MDWLAPNGARVGTEAAAMTCERHAGQPVIPRVTGTFERMPTTIACCGAEPGTITRMVQEVNAMARSE
jgi:hypothetical protein